MNELKQQNRGEPLATAAYYKLLPLGADVWYTHRAAVARYNKNLKGWKLVEGVYKNEYLPGERVPFQDILSYGFLNWPKRKNINKTIMVWPQEGDGILMGKLRRSIGASYPGTKPSFSYFGDDYEPGYHASVMYVDLYIIKEKYDTADYLLAPMWAVEKIKSERT